VRRTRSVPSRSLTTGQRKTSNQVLRRWRGQHLAIASLLLKSPRVDRHTSPAQSHRGPDRRREGLHREEPPPWVLDDPLALGLAGKTAASATARPRAIIISAEDPSLPSIRLPGTQRLIGRAVTSVGSRYGTPGPPPMAMSGFAARRVQGTGIRRRARLALLSRLVGINARTGRRRAGPARENQLER